MSEAFAAFWASIARTFVPIAVGAVLSGLASANIVVDPEFEATLGTLLAAGFSAGYYLAVRLLETYVTPKFGWLLGLAKAPAVYSPVAPKDIPVAVTTATDSIEIAATDGDTPTENRGSF